MPGQRHPGLDHSGLGDPVQRFYMMGLAESTHKLYACGVRRFMGICATAGRAPVPADEDTLCHFAASLAVDGLRHRTIKSYMAGVRHLHISERYGDPFSAGLHRLHYVLRGVKRAEGMAGVSNVSVGLLCFARSKECGTLGHTRQMWSCFGRHAAWHFSALCGSGN